MKPKNKYQKEILSLSKRLPKLSNTKKKWAIRTLFTPLMYRTKNISICFECGHKWQNKVSTLTCPHCNTKLQVNDNKAWRITDYQYFNIVTVVKGYQVVRYFIVQRSYYLNKPVEYFFSELNIHWLDSNGKYTVISRLISPFYAYKKQPWNLSSFLEIRLFNDSYFNCKSTTYPNIKLIDAWCSKSVRYLIGIFTSRRSLFKGLNERYKDLSINDIQSINQFNQTQGREDNIIIEEWIINKPLL